MKEANYTINNIRWVLRFSAWLFFCTLALAALTCFFGVAPAMYLIWSGIFGALWFSLLVLAWRFRSDVLSTLALLLAIFGHLVLRDHYLPGNQYGYGKDLQGGLIILAVGNGLLTALRKPLCRKLER